MHDPWARQLWGNVALMTQEDEGWALLEYY